MTLISDMGFSSITSYSIYLDKGASETPRYQLLFNSTTPSGQIINGPSYALQTGSNYSFAISANNVHGEGPISTSSASV